MNEQVSVWKANLNSGLIMGLTGVVYQLVIYFLGLSFNRFQGWIFLAILIFLTFYLLKSYRNTYLNGYITYGQSLGAGVIMFLYYSIIMAIFTYILYKFIDSGLTAKLLALSEETLVKKGKPQEVIDVAMTMYKKIFIPEIMAPSSILNNMFSGTIIALLVSIFIRREGNPLVDSPSN